MPGVASRETVVYNHNAAFIASPYARAGITENNPIHADMLYAALKARLAFICNVVINANKEIIYAVAGDCALAHSAGCGFLDGKCRVRGTGADIVITSNGGYPMDQNLYQAVKGMTAAEASVKKGGAIIILAEAEDGHGGEEFYNTFSREKDLNRMLASFMATPKENTRVDQWQSQIFARVLQHARVFMVTRAPADMVRGLHMTPANTIEEAVAAAEAVLGNPRAAITAIPDGVAVMVV
jgi:nickel-dependent lactate racemase